MNKSVLIQGGKPLHGQISIQGSKNATLPILASSVMFKGKVTLKNVPDLSDVKEMLSILSFLGVQHHYDKGVLTLDCSKIENNTIPDSLTARIRASSLLLGPLFSRFGIASCGMSGGCSIGVRPIDIHLKGFKKIGAKTSIEKGLVYVSKEKLIQGEFTLPIPSVGATENLIMASVFSEDKVTLRNIAKEPEVMGLIEFLNRAGASIHFSDDHSTLIIDGVKQLHSVEYEIQPDRIEAGTFLIAGFATKGSIDLIGSNPNHLSSLLETLGDMGAKISINGERLSVSYDGVIRGTTIKTSVYPGFPTDLQPQIGVLLTQANKPSCLIENVFEDRFQYINELLRLNANIKVEGTTAYIQPSDLSGCHVYGSDLRGSASLVLAGLCADGTTKVSGLRHLFRGYENFVEKLDYLGADISFADF